MPELPEVETIKLGLQKHLVGHTIKDITPMPHNGPRPSKPRRV